MKKQNKAFTLVELMIVIAIIGVLAATLLPRLQGAQERSRDSGRITSLKSTASVMEVYYSDAGEYPADPSGTAGCLSDATGAVTDTALTSLLKGGIAPKDPSGGNEVGAVTGCSEGGVLGYLPLTKASIANNGYILVANVEGVNSANFVATSVAANDDYDSITLLDEVPSTTTAGDAIYIERS